MGALGGDDRVHVHGAALAVDAPRRHGRVRGALRADPRARSCSSPSPRSSASTCRDANFGAALALLAIASLSFIGVGMMTSVLPLISPEKGAQLGFVAPGADARRLGRLLPRVRHAALDAAASRSSRPATYALRGDRASIITGAGLAWANIWPLLVIAVASIPLGLADLPRRRAVREEARKAEAVRLVRVCYKLSRSRQARRPSRQWGRRGASGRSLREHRVRGPRRGTAELGSRDPAHAAVEAGLLEDRLRELGPRALAVRGEVPDAARQLDELARRRREMADIGRAAALVVDDRDLVALGAETQHRAHEVVARPAEEPRRADDPRVVARGRLTVQLRPPVGRQRIRCVRLDVRLALAAVEDVVGGEVRRAARRARRRAACRRRSRPPRPADRPRRRRRPSRRPRGGRGRARRAAAAAASRPSPRA